MKVRHAPLKSDKGESQVVQPSSFGFSGGASSAVFLSCSALPPCWAAGCAASEEHISCRSPSMAFLSRPLPMGEASGTLATLNSWPWFLLLRGRLFRSTRLCTLCIGGRLCFQVWNLTGKFFASINIVVRKPFWPLREGQESPWAFFDIVSEHVDRADSTGTAVYLTFQKLLTRDSRVPLAVM